MHRKHILLPALWLAGFNFIILSPHYSVLRSPHIDHQTNVCKQYFHPFIHSWSANIKLIKVHNFMKLRFNFHDVSTNRSPVIIQNTLQYMASLEIWYPLKLNLASPDSYCYIIHRIVTFLHLWELVNTLMGSWSFWSIFTRLQH